MSERENVELGEWFAAQSCVDKKWPTDGVKWSIRTEPRDKVLAEMLQSRCVGSD